MDVLYKYVTHTRALTCIPEVGDGTLRATQPAALNDPFECAVATHYVFSDEWEENRKLADTLTQINESNPVTAEAVDRARTDYGSLFTRQLFAKQVSTRSASSLLLRIRSTRCCGPTTPPTAPDSPSATTSTNFARLPARTNSCDASHTGTGHPRSSTR